MRAARTAGVNRERVGWVVVVAAALGVVVASLVSPSVLSIPVTVSDKLYHAVAYFVLALVGFYATETEKYKIAVVVFALGACVELTQAFVPYRTASFADVAANSVGVVGAVVVAFVVDT